MNSQVLAIQYQKQRRERNCRWKDSTARQTLQSLFSPQLGKCCRSPLYIDVHSLIQRFYTSTAGPRYIRGCCLMLERRYGFRAGA